MSSKEFKGLLVGKKNREVYQPLENDYYKNLSNGRMGRIKLEDAQRLFVIPIALNKMAEKNPLLLRLIEVGSFSLESYTDEEIKEIENNYK